MFGLKMFLAGMLLGAGGMLFSLQFHVMRTNDGLTVVPRTHQPPLRSTYVDVRRWSLAMWRNYPEVTEALVKSGRVDLMATGAAKALVPESVETGLEGLGETVREKTKKAIDAIVPIRFTNPREANVDDDEERDPSVTDREPPDVIERGYRTPLTPLHASSPQIAIRSEEVLPQGFSPGSLPILQQPVPIPEETLPPSRPRSGITDPPTGQNGTAQPEWVRGLLRSLIPPPTSSESSARDFGQSHLRYDFEAPSPLEQALPPSSPWSTPVNKPQQAPHRAVRPF